MFPVSEGKMKDPFFEPPNQQCTATGGGGFRVFFQATGENLITPAIFLVFPDFKLQERLNEKAFSWFYDLGITQYL